MLQRKFHDTRLWTLITSNAWNVGAVLSKPNETRQNQTPNRSFEFSREKVPPQQLSSVPFDPGNGRARGRQWFQDQHVLDGGRRSVPQRRQWAHPGRAPSESRGLRNRPVLETKPPAKYSEALIQRQRKQRSQHRRGTIRPFFHVIRIFFFSLWICQI